MEITALNFESYALDYAEGNLKGEALAAMEEYLQAHPGLCEELALISAVTLPSLPEAYAGKAALQQRRRKIAWLPVAFGASMAATILLAIGVIWLALGSPEGELAATPTVGVKIGLPAMVQNHGTGVAPAPSAVERQSGSAEERISYSSTGQFVAATSAEDARQREQIAYASLPGPVEPDPEESLPVAVTIKLKKVQSYVLPVTLEFHQLEHQGLQAWESEATALHTSRERAVRWAGFKDGTLSLLQDRLMPSGLSDLLAN